VGGMTRPRGSARLLSGAAVAIVLAFFLFPFLWMVQASFKTQVEITRIPPAWWFTPTLANYVEVFRGQNFARFVWNSLVIASASTLASLALGLPAAYSIARYRQQWLGLTILVARIVPGITFLIPWYILFSRMGLIDTHLSLVLSHMVVGMPFIIWVMVSYFEQLPEELEEAARVDGCTRQGAFWSVILPLSAPGVLTSATLAFIFSWNNFMFAVVLAGDRVRTLPVAVFNFLTYATVNWGALMAAAVTITVPVLIIGLLAQRHVIAGLTAGGLKG
jgi:multiple sugar transport system permease protein